jgi:5-methylcytosine-specific restriction endonuclease McrA
LNSWARDEGVYQIDHRIPLSKGGADPPSNMQWLTTQQHKAKTAQERR